MRGAEPQYITLECVLRS